MQSQVGPGKTRVIEDMPTKRKMINNLIEYTSTLSNDELLKINEHTQVASGYEIVIPSEEI